jgi:hypothetical protein
MLNSCVPDAIGVHNRHVPAVFRYDLFNRRAVMES